MSIQQCRLIFAETLRTLQVEDADLGDDGMCQLRLKYDWMPALNFCYVESKDSLLVFAQAGFIDSDDETEVYKDLMHRQFLFDKSRGVTFSLAGDNNALTVQMMLDVGSLTVALLADVLQDFVEEVRFAVFRINDIDEDDFSSNFGTTYTNSIIVG
ncbi:MAG: type III secretion system chaperone [Succinivibrio dextrinosolvens]|uniref:type III secretion system chaperone n=1 Tax=Succinivibrio sp. TaxID=2053619 RepID=UPI0025E77EBC|nr:type III secretion system chaperone [Succinivibrio sp.]MBQ9221022.1 type III secretion system chaperone [Succinivibrio sp.]MDY6420743.1 type III secretion system chaperone [Succinivibrio dextrinosolvens]MDY6465280.1 type III secretion system chaperone [Succinivibrio dextrinosolvens]